MLFTILKKKKKTIAYYFRNNAKKTIEENKKGIAEISLKIKLHEATQIVSLSYLSKTYFKKSRQWFSQRLNNNIVNGNPAKFTEEELNILDFALKDISKKIGSISIS